MNILIDLLPKSIKIEGVEYDINSDFRTSILFELMMQDAELDDKEKFRSALELYYPTIPGDNEKAIESIMWFYRCGKDIVKTKGVGKGKSEQIYSYDHDDDYIYSAFLDQYGVDLQDIEYLHWWKFKAMFKALKEDNMIVKIMGYRSMNISSIKDKEQRDHYKKLQEIYKIPTNINKDDEEKINDIEKALMGNGDLTSIL